MRFCGDCGAELDAPPPTRCRRCGVEHHKNSRPCAGALIENHGRILLVRRNIEPYRGYWDIPGGHCDAGEHPADTAVREAMEETGWAILITGIFGIWMDSEGEIDSLVVYYRARPTAQVRAPDAGETMELGWFEAAALPRNIAFPDHSRHVLAAWEPAVAVPVAPSDSD